MTRVHDGPQVAALVAAVGPSWRHDRSSRATVHVWWVVFLVLHVVAAFFFALMTYGYWKLRSVQLSTWLDFYSLGMGPKYHYTIAITHGIIAALHILFAVIMVARSIRYGKLTFRGEHENPQSCGRSREFEKQHGFGRLPGIFSRYYHMLFARDGLFGVEGHYYDTLLLLRELVETSLQTNQGYRMSRNVPRVWLNSLYVTLLVINCWSTAIVHHVFRDSPIKKRLIALLCDCLLDLASSVGMPIILVALYSTEFDASTGNFDELQWFDDVWLVNAMSEFTIILVVSWADLVGRLVFAVSMLNNMNTMEWLMAKTTKPAPRTMSSVPGDAAIAPVPYEKSSTRVEVRVRSMGAWRDRVLVPRLMAKFLRFGFLFWGMVVLVFHLHAGSNPSLSQCLMQLRPWGVIKPACALVLLNCYTDGLDGSSDLVAAQWEQLDAYSVGGILIRHCPSLEIPPLLRSFHQMKSFQVYNSTITRWDQDAELNQVDHPVAAAVVLIRVNVTSGELPRGLQSPNFPQSLNIIGFIVSNLKSLPDDLHLKWPRYSTLHFEYAQFTEFPVVLWKLVPQKLLFGNNPIVDVPKELFGLDGLQYLDLAQTSISSLPKDVPLVSPTLVSINVDFTNISSFWPWVDPWLSRLATSSSSQALSAAGSPYCWERERILSGAQTEFSAVVTLGNEAEEMSMLMDASEANWPLLKSAVGCDPSFSFRYPLALDDREQALQQIE